PESDRAHQNGRNSRPSPGPRPCGFISGVRLSFGISLLSEFDQFAGAFSAFQDMEVLGIGEVELLGRVDPGLQSFVVDAAFALRIRIPFEDVLLKPLEELRIVLILGKKLTFVHEILPGLLNHLCRSLLRLTRNSQFFPNSVEIPLTAHSYCRWSSCCSRRYVA